MTHDDRLTEQTHRILKALLAEPAAEWLGTKISPAAGLKPGSIYPVLIRMERLGWLTSRWEEVDTRPRRRLYRLTVEGRDLAEAIESGPAMAMPI